MSQQSSSDDEVQEPKSWIETAIVENPPLEPGDICSDDPNVISPSEESSMADSTEVLEKEIPALKTLTIKVLGETMAPIEETGLKSKVEDRVVMISSGQQNTTSDCDQEVGMILKSANEKEEVEDKELIISSGQRNNTPVSEEESEEDDLTIFLTEMMAPIEESGFKSVDEESVLMISPGQQNAASKNEEEIPKSRSSLNDEEVNEGQNCMLMAPSNGRDVAEKENNIAVVPSDIGNVTTNKSFLMMTSPDKGNSTLKCEDTASGMVMSPLKIDVRGMKNGKVMIPLREEDKFNGLAKMLSVIGEVQTKMNNMRMRSSYEKDAQEKENGIIMASSNRENVKTKDNAEKVFSDGENGTLENEDIAISPVEESITLESVVIYNSKHQPVLENATVINPGVKNTIFPMDKAPLEYSDYVILGQLKNITNDSIQEREEALPENKPLLVPTEPHPNQRPAMVVPLEDTRPSQSSPQLLSVIVPSVETPSGSIETGMQHIGLAVSPDTSTEDDHDSPPSPPRHWNVEAERNEVLRLTAVIWKLRLLVVLTVLAMFAIVFTFQSYAVSFQCKPCPLQASVPTVPQYEWMDPNDYPDTITTNQPYTFPDITVTSKTEAQRSSKGRDFYTSNDATQSKKNKFVRIVYPENPHENPDIVKVGDSEEEEQEEIITEEELSSLWSTFNIQAKKFEQGLNDVTEEHPGEMSVIDFHPLAKEKVVEKRENEGKGQDDGKKESGPNHVVKKDLNDTYTTGSD